MIRKLRPAVMVLMVSTLHAIAAEPRPHETDDKVFIVLQETKANAREISLDKKIINQVTEMANLELGPFLALTVLTAAGLDCCPPIEKLSDTVWRCCDGSKTIITNNASVGKLLTTTHQLTRRDWEHFKERNGIMAGDRKILDKLLEMRPQA